MRVFQFALCFLSFPSFPSNPYPFPLCSALLDHLLLSPPPTMPSFMCDYCQNSLKKAQLDKHMLVELPSSGFNLDPPPPLHCFIEVPDPFLLTPSLCFSLSLSVVG